MPKTRKSLYSKHHIPIILVIIIAVTISARIIDIDKPYETWDEVTTYSVGLNMWYNIIIGDFTPETWKTYNTDFSGSLHPPLVRYVYGIVNGAYIFSQTGTELFSSSYGDAVLTMAELKSMAPGRYLSSVFATGTAVIIFLISKKYFGIITATLAALIFALLPVSLAQTRLASMESMLTFMYSITVYFFIRGLESKKFFIISMIFVGLSIASKYNSVTLFALLPAIYFVFDRPKIVGKKHLLLIPVFGILVLFLIWPRFWPDPIGGALANINGWNTMAMQGSNVGEYFLGNFENLHPIYYETVYVMVTMPIILLLFFFGGIVKSINKRTFGENVFLLWFALPLVIYSFYQFKMGGPRFIFMIYPAISVLTAIGISTTADYLKSRHKKYGKIFQETLIAGIFLYLIAIVIFIHPYYLVYYNEIVGGPKNAFENNLFIIGRSGEGIDEATYFLNKLADVNASVQLFVMPRHVIPPLREDLNDITPFVPKYLSNTGDNENWDLTNVTPKADYLVENTFFRWHMNATFHETILTDYDLINTVQVQGGELAWIYVRKI